jgi:hypothetical protein
MDDRAGGPLMNPYRKFDPYKNIEPGTRAKAAKVAKEGTGNTITLAGLATLAAPPAESANSCFRSIASSEGEAGRGRRPVSVTPSLTDIPTDWAAGLPRWSVVRHGARLTICCPCSKAGGRAHTLWTALIAPRNGQFQSVCFQAGHSAPLLLWSGHGPVLL